MVRRRIERLTTLWVFASITLTCLPEAMRHVSLVTCRIIQDGQRAGARFGKNIAYGYQRDFSRLRVGDKQRDDLRYRDSGNKEVFFTVIQLTSYD